MSSAYVCRSLLLHGIDCATFAMSHSTTLWPNNVKDWGNRCDKVGLLKISVQWHLRIMMPFAIITIASVKLPGLQSSCIMFVELYYNVRSIQYHACMSKNEFTTVKLISWHPDNQKKHCV